MLWLTGFFKEGLGHGGGRFDGGQVTAAEGEGEGKTTGAGADVDESVVGLDFEGEAIEKGVVGAVGVGAEADGHAVPVVVVGVGLVAEAFGLGVFGLDHGEPFFSGVGSRHWIGVTSVG